jgi:hypothetical protein
VRRAFLLASLIPLLASQPATAQSVLERSPNLHGQWVPERGHSVFVVAHRFEIFRGGEDLFSVPTLTFASGLPGGFGIGVDYTSFSEAIPGRLGKNEAQFWLKRALLVREDAGVAGMLAYNHAAGSFDGAASGGFDFGRAGLHAELRGFSDLFGSGSAGAAGAVGASVRVTPHLAVTGDAGRVLSADTFGVVWSGALAAEIPGTPHSLSLQIANSGATTLQGASRPKTLGPGSTRYGFVFTVPLGSLAQWGRIFRPAPVAPPPAPGVVRIDMRSIEFMPGEIRVGRGQVVEWINLDPVVHTVTADDGSWGSGSVGEGEVFRHTFTEAGRHTYYCIPHPQMRGVLIVE